MTALETARAARGRYLGLVAFSIIVLVTTISIPLLAGASTFRGGLSVDVTSADRIDSDVYIVAPETNFNATAPHNVSIAAITGSVRGRIDGNLHLLAGRNNIRADVAGSVYVAAGDVSIHNRVGGDLVVAGGDVTINSGATIAGDLIIASGTARIDGTVRGSVYGTALTLQHHGTVERNVEIQTSRLVLGGNARVNGEVRYQSPVDARVASSARVLGDIERTNAAPWSGVGPGALKPFGALLKLTWSLLTGAALVVAMPRLMSRIADHGALVLQPSAVGLLSMILLPIVALLLLGTTIGVPIGLILLLLLPIGLYLSQVFAGITLGRLLLPRSWHDGSRGVLLLSMTLGVLIIGFIRMVPVPYLGPIVTALVTFWGFGALVMLVTDLTSRRLRQQGA